MDEYLKVELEIRMDKKSLAQVVDNPESVNAIGRAVLLALLGKGANAVIDTVTMNGEVYERATDD